MSFIRHVQAILISAIFLGILAPQYAFSQERCASILADSAWNLNLSQAATAIVTAAQADRGVTFYQGRILKNADYYVVSPFPGKEIQTLQLTEAKLQEFIRKQQAFLESDSHLAVGVWFDSASQTYFIDVVLLVDAKQPAAQKITEALARKHKQLAYYDLKNAREIRVDLKD